MTAETYLPDYVAKCGIIDLDDLDQDLVLIQQPYLLSSLWYKSKLFVFGGKYYLKELETRTYEQVCTYDYHGNSMKTTTIKQNGS